MQKSGRGSVKRAYSLDALRGFAILTMVLSGVIPYKGLPAWMYHAQTPPPSRVFDPNLPGLTWVDLVFPFFIFALGAAIPMALNKRIQKGYSKLKLFKYIGERTFLLGFFAIFLFHVRPHIINPDIYTQSDPGTFLLALAGFLAMFAIFLRFPRSWPKKLQYALRIGGFLTAILLMTFINYPDGQGFSLSRSDIIIRVLTNVYFFGSLVYLLTHNRLILRLGIMGILIALRLSHSVQGWVQPVWEFSPFPWLYKLYYLQYLFIAIPGMIIGDLALNWIKETTNTIEFKWSHKRFAILVGLMFLFVVVMLVGLQARWVWQTVLVALFLCGSGYFLFRKPGNKTEKFLQTLFHWGSYFLIVGLIFEPYEGGIKKDHPTMSYYFVTSGLAVYMIIAFTVLLNVFKQKKSLNLLIDNGQNPMIAYVGFANLLWPVFGLLNIDTFINNITSASPWLGFIKGVLYT
ncbi:MAG TPA: DUF5009 domain-containing protein, partial [bacterium]|nr:DUF5009 domain-containing protein [bacterium]